MKNKIIVALLVFTAIIISNQIVFFVDINNQYSNSEIINIAGRQRMYSQRVMKLMLFSQIDTSHQQEKDFTELDAAIDRFSNAHQFLKEQNASNFKTEKIDSLFTVVEQPYSNILQGYAAIKTNEINYNKPISKEKLNELRTNEIQFLKNMDFIVGTYQNIAEERLTRLRNIQFIFNAISVLLIVYIFTFIILPLSKKT